MAVVFPSDEWIKSVGSASQTDSELKDRIKDFAGTFVFQVDPEEGMLDRPFYLYFKLDGEGVHSGVALSSLDERPDVDYVIAGKYSKWKAVLNEEIDPMKALMTRKLWLAKGPMMKVLKKQKMAMRLLELCGEMEAEFIDETAA